METFQCDLCDFSTQSKAGLKIHLGKKHKDEIRNPKYENFTTKKSEGNECYQVLDTKSQRSLIFIHDMKCWSYFYPCHDLASLIPQDDHPVLDDSGGLHILDTSVLQDNLLDWDHIYRLIIGYSLEN